MFDMSGPSIFREIYSTPSEIVVKMSCFHTAVYGFGKVSSRTVINNSHKSIRTVILFQFTHFIFNLLISFVYLNPTGHYSGACVPRSNEYYPSRSYDKYNCTRRNEKFLVIFLSRHVFILIIISMRAHESVPCLLFFARIF